MSAAGQKDKFTPELRILWLPCCRLRDHPLGEVFRAEAARPANTSKPAGADRSATPVPRRHRRRIHPKPPQHRQQWPSGRASVTVKNDSQERAVVVENSLYRVEISNRGAS